MNEFELLAKLIPTLSTNSSVVTGAGDDCAIIDLGAPDTFTLLKTDAVVEGVHFTPETSPEKIGRKAVARALSDVAAMAGKPVAALVTIGLKKNFEPQWVERLYAGINEISQQFAMAVAGGETTRSPNDFFLSVTIVGTVPKNRIIRRAGAQPGDAIFVTGELGGSLSGKHLDFVPRLVEASWLAENYPLSSMMDLSDGLAGDLRHILHASKVGAELLSTAIPVSRAARLHAKNESSAKPPLLAALTDGEDFELLFTVASKFAVPVLDGWKKRFPETNISCIGKITKEPGLKLRDKDGVRELKAHGYAHFQQS